MIEATPPSTPDSKSSSTSPNESPVSLLIKEHEMQPQLVEQIQRYNIAVPTKEDVNDFEDLDTPIGTPTASPISTPLSSSVIELGSLLEGSPDSPSISQSSPQLPEIKSKRSSLVLESAPSVSGKSSRGTLHLLQFVATQ